MLMLKPFKLTLILLVFIPITCQAAAKHPEKWYQQKWCKEHGGKAEVRLPDGTRCDCIIETHSIEFDFGKKWAESIGQSLYYSLQTGKKAGVVLIVEDPGDYKYWLRLNSTIEHHGLKIDTWKTD